jgi:hypothetical protein
MTNVILMEEQRFENLLNKVEQMYQALIKNPGNTLNEINGFVSESDACKLIGKSKTWLWRKRTEGVLPYKKLGAKIFYAKTDLFNLLKEVA